MNGMQGHMNGDAAYHRKKQTELPVALIDQVVRQQEEIERLRKEIERLCKVMLEAWQDHDWLLIANEVYDMKDIAKPHIGNEPLEPGRDMRDLVKRLRSYCFDHSDDEITFEAADEIERLRQQRDELVAALKQIPEVSFWEDARAICYAALAKIEGSAK